MRWVCRLVGHADVRVFDRVRVTGWSIAGAEFEVIASHHECGRCGKRPL